MWDSYVRKAGIIITKIDDAEKKDLHENSAERSRLYTVNAIEDISWIYENGEFQFSRWHQYMDFTLPGHKEIFIDDMKKTIQNDEFSFNKDILPILNQVLSDDEKRNRVIEAFKNATKGLERNIIDTFGRTVNVNIILYLGLCNGAGWAMQIDNKQYIMLGIEKIIELNWCDENLKIIKKDFNDDLLTMTHSNQRYFGDWVWYKGHSDVGYYLGARFVQWVNQRYEFDEMICFDMIKVRDEWDKYLCS